MIVTGLKLTNLRAIETAEFRFQQGFNLIVGVNGVQETSVLDAFLNRLAAIARYANRLSLACVVLWNRRHPYRRSTDDIKCLKVESFFLRYTND